MTSRRSNRDHSRLTLRLDAVWDSASLYQLAEYEGRHLDEGRHVVAEVENRIVAAVPLAGGRPLADPSVATARIVPLLRQRAAQIRA